MCYPCSENRGAEQLRSYCEADLRLCFRLCRLSIFPCGCSFIVCDILLDVFLFLRQRNLSESSESNCLSDAILMGLRFSVTLSFLARLHEVHRAIAVTSVVHVPVPVPVPVRVRVTLALKFSRSPYLYNHSSESIHTWTIDTL